MKDFRFPMFDDKSKLVKERRDNVIAIKKQGVCFFKGFFLWNKKFIVYKRKKWDRDIKIFSSFFEDVENGWNIESGKNGRKSRALFYTYINTEKRINKIVPYILSFLTN